MCLDTITKKDVVLEKDLTLYKAVNKDSRGRYRPLCFDDKYPLFLINKTHKTKYYIYWTQNTTTKFKINLHRKQEGEANTYIQKQ